MLQILSFLSFFLKLTLHSDNVIVVEDNVFVFWDPKPSHQFYNTYHS